MIFQHLWQGILVGLSATIPLGPIGVLCIQRTLNKGRTSGFVSGLGAASADSVYAILAGFGVSVIIDSLIQHQVAIRLVGAVVLLGMGYKVFTTNPGIQLRRQMRRKHKGLFGDFVSTFALTASNPLTVIYFIGIFAGFNIVSTRSDVLSIAILIVGVFTGAVSWWFTLTSIVNTFRKKFRLRSLLYINRVAGILIILFAIGVGVSVLFID